MKIYQDALSNKHRRKAVGMSKTKISKMIRMFVSKVKYLLSREYFNNFSSSSVIFLISAASK